MKTRGNEFTFRRADAVAIAAVVVAVVALLAYFLIPAASVTEVTAQVYQDGQLLKTLSLNQDQEMMVEGAYRNQIIVRDGKIAIVQSDCPGEDCVHTGWIQRSGMSIVCLPNRVEIRLTAADGEDDVDVMVW